MDIDLGFILQIVLTVVAWVKGWQWKALLPVVVGFASGFVVPAVVSPDTEAFSTVALVINFAVVAVLVYMIVKPPKLKKSK